MEFRSAIYRIESDGEKDTTLLEVKREGDAEWKTCFVFPRSINYNAHTYIAASGQERRRRAVYIDSIMFYDNEVEIEGE